MTSIAYSSVSIQTSSRSSPATPIWFGEVALLIQQLHKQGVLDALSTQVRFARRRFARFEVIDFMAVLFGYAISGERTMQAFYERLRPWASANVRAFRTRWLALSLGAQSVSLGADPGTGGSPASSGSLR